MIKSAIVATSLLLATSVSSHPKGSGELTFISHHDESRLYQAFISLHHALHSGQPADGFKVYLTPQDKARLLAAGFELTPVLKLDDADLKRQSSTAQSEFHIDNFECFENLEDSQDGLFDLSIDYPHLVELVKIGESERKVNGAGGHDLEVIKLTANNDITDKPKLFIHSAMHAREYATAPTVLAFIRHMLEGYEVDSDITWILQHHEIHVLLHMNPDGRERAEEGVLWRKNANDSYCQIDPDRSGADLNRNFSYSWGSNPIGSSSDECAGTFRGSSPASEPETQAVETYVRSLFPDLRGPNDDDRAPDSVQGIHLDIHSYGELLLWPWGHIEQEAPNGTELEQLGRKFAFFNDYEPLQSVGLYPADGTSEDISYGELGVPHFTFELGREFFQACDYYEDSIKHQNIAAFKYAARVVGAPYKQPMGPEVTLITVNGEAEPSLAQSQEVTFVVHSSSEQIKLQGNSKTEIEAAAMRFAINQLPSLEDAQVEPMTLLSPSSDAGRGWGRFSTEGLAMGRHQLFVQVQDENDYWGPVYSAFFHITENAQGGSAPIAEFDLSCSALECSFDASNTIDLDGDIAQFQWLIDDVAIEQTGQTIEFNFENAGNYTIKLEVTDSQGNNSSAERQLTVNADTDSSTVDTPKDSGGSGGGGALSLWLIALAGALRLGRGAR